MNSSRSLPALALLSLVLLLLVGGGACSSSSPGSGGSAGTSTAAPTLSGVYTTTDAGDFTWIDFMDATTYALWKTAPCDATVGTDTSCGQQGTYTVDGSGTGVTVSLTSGDTGTVTTISLAQVQLATADAQNNLGPASLGGAGTSLQPLGLVGSDAGTGLVSSGAPLVNGQVPVASFQATGSSGKTQTLTAAADLSVGVFGECGLDGALKPLLGSLMHVLEASGVELSAELIVVYNKELHTGDNTLEILFGGGPAATASALAGLAPATLQTLLKNFGPEAGILVGATVSLDFDGTFGKVHFSVDAYSGADIFAAGGGTWKLIWSQDPSEIGETGYWASITVVSGAVCKAGGIVFASDNALTTLWNLVTGGPTPMSLPPVCGIPSSGSLNCDQCTQANCCTEATTCQGVSGCSNLYQCLALGGGSWAYSLGCKLGAASAAKAPAAAMETCMDKCETQCGTSSALIFGQP